ncbi:MAG: divalent-cation tolerance protein CutA [Thermoprotei archaeon]|nr:MAG: divalent-cation tolerance protein CutA [Thermoprotei archaeon]
MAQKIIIFLTTIDSEEQARKMSREIIKHRLAACVSILNINSFYFWEGKIADEKEYLLIIKTSPEKIDDLVNWLQKNHPYTIPELIRIDGLAFEPYFRWLKEYLST